MLKALREKHGLTQTAVCAHAKVSRSTLASIEAGLHFVKLDTLQLIADAMRLPTIEKTDLLSCWIRDTIGDKAWAELRATIRRGK